MSNLLVYGTLKRGFNLHSYLKNCTYTGDITLDGYRMYSLGPFPGIKPEEGHEVLCEAYEDVPEETITLLDKIEGFYGQDNPWNLYDREEIEIGNNSYYIYVMYDADQKGTPTKIGEWGYAQ